MRNHSIAIQGSAASFHDLAARKFFGEDISPIECNSFRDVCERIASNNADYGVIAIENRIAGSILFNYHLIEQFNLNIIGETYLPIELNLYSAMPGSVKNVREIFSHPMALGQCQQFLSQLTDVKVTEFRDTSTCAKMLCEEKNEAVAVIAGPAVAKQYELHLLENNLSDVQFNFTRFYILTKGQDYVPDANKASVSFHAKNRPGELCDVLLMFRKQGLNLTKIQSVPLPYGNDTYAFHMDVEFDSVDQLKKAIRTMKRTVKSAKILGMYKNEGMPADKMDLKIVMHEN